VAPHDWQTYWIRILAIATPPQEMKDWKNGDPFFQSNPELL